MLDLVDQLLERRNYLSRDAREFFVGRVMSGQCVCFALPRVFYSRPLQTSRCHSWYAVRDKSTCAPVLRASQITYLATEDCLGRQDMSDPYTARHACNNTVSFSPPLLHSSGAYIVHPVFVPP